VKCQTTLKNGIQKDLVVLWRMTVRNILYALEKRQQDLADICGLSRQSLATMLCRDDFHLTGIQFLGTMRALEELIRDCDADRERKRCARTYYDKLQECYAKTGFIFDKEETK
jgi:hypothetical protein